jgi:hypothetical protein
MNFTRQSTRQSLNGRLPTPACVSWMPLRKPTLMDFALAHRESDRAGVACAGANKLAWYAPLPPARDRLAGAVAADKRMRSA